MKTFTCHVFRNTYETTDVLVQANDEAEAAELVSDLVRSLLRTTVDWKCNEVEIECLPEDCEVVPNE